MKTVLKPSARDDLRALRTWSESQWGEVRARDYLRGLLETIRSLVDNPFLGRPREAIFPGLRSVVSRQYIIFYVVGTPGISIFAVMHEKRNLAALDFADLFEGDERP